MLKKSIAIFFLSIIVIFPVMATEKCDFTPPNNSSILQWRTHRKYYWSQHICSSFHGNLLYNDQIVLLGDWTDLGTYGRFVTGSKYVHVSFEYENVQVPFTVYPHGTDCANLGKSELKNFGFTDIYMVTQRIDSTTTRKRLVSGIDSQIKFIPIGGLPEGVEPAKLICPAPPPPPKPPKPPCPDLNLTIRGVLLPVRRGTARITGDWCD